MVKINVTRPIAFPIFSGRSIDLKPGVHEVDERAFEHYYVKSLFARNVISIVGRKVVQPLKKSEAVVIEEQPQTIKEEIEPEDVDVEPYMDEEPKKEVVTKASKRVKRGK